MPKKILLADDSMTIQKVISITLASEDVDMVIVSDGNAAVAKAREIKPDLILADVAMPGKSGYEVCEIIKSDPQLYKIPVLLLAGTFEPLNKEEAARVKADDSIVKPFESTSFVEKVKSLLAKAEAEAAAPIQVEPPPPVEVKPELTGNVWEAGDFLGTSEEQVAEASLAAESELGDFLGGGLFEEAASEADAEIAASPEQAFMDLDLGAEPSAPKQAAPPPPAAPPRPPAVQRPVAPPPAPPQAPSVDFESFKAEPFGAPQEEEAPSFWEQPDAPVAPPAPPVAQWPVAPPPPTPPRPPVVERPVAPPLSAPERPAQSASPELLKLYQKQGERPLSAPAAAPKPVERVVTQVAAAAEPLVGAAVQAMPGVSGVLSRDEIKEIVRKTAREVIEEIAWQVVPELAEEIVTTEMMKFRDVFMKVKEKRA